MVLVVEGTSTVAIPDDTVTVEIPVPVKLTVPAKPRLFESLKIPILTSLRPGICSYRGILFGRRGGLGLKTKSMPTQ